MRTAPRTLRTVHAMMPDGTVRAITFTADADTFFSRPARCTVRGRTVRGTAYQASDFTIVDGRAVDRPSTAADVFYADAPTVRLGVLMFTPRGVNAHLVNRPA